MIFAIALLLALPALAQAAAVTVTVDGKKVKWPAAPVKSGNAMLVDAKTLLPLIGASYSYDKAKKKLTAKADGHTLVMTAGSKSATLDGGKYPLAAAPAATKTGLNIPGDAAARAFGGEVQWVSGTQYDIMGKKKWRSVVTSQVTSLVRKLVDAQEKENVNAIGSLVQAAEPGIAEWLQNETSYYDDYEFDLQLKSSEVTEIGTGYAAVEAVIGQTLLEGPYELDKDLTVEYFFEKIGGQWKITYITPLHTNYWIPEEPDGAEAVSGLVNEFAEGMSEALNDEDADAYASWADKSVADQERDRIQAFFDEQEQQSEIYDVKIVHLEEDGSVYVVVYEDVTVESSEGTEFWDSQTFYRLVPQEDGKLRTDFGYNLVFERL